MAKYTKKWDKEFTKRYSNAIQELQSLENEYKEMVDNNPDAWISVYPEYSTIEFGDNNGFYITHFKEGDLPNKTNEHVNVTIQSPNGMFGFDFVTLDSLIKFRNSLMVEIDKFQRPVEEVKNVISDDDCEDEEEGWEDNEYQEYTIQASRTCVESWTHTVQARCACEAYRLVQDDDDGSTHDDNNDYNDYGDIDYEMI